MKDGFNYNPIELQIIRNNWREFAEKHKGNFKSEIGKSNDSFVGAGVEWEVLRFELAIEYKDSLIIFKVSETHPLKVRYDLTNESSFNFIIYLEDIFEKISKIFGMKEIELNKPEFDRKFIIKGNDERKIHKFFVNSIVEYFADKDISNFKLETTKGKSYLETTLQIDILKKGILDELFEVFKHSIDNVLELNN